MKKLLLICAMLMMCLTGCGEEKTQDPVKITAVETFNVDMSHYKNMSSVNHHFKGITPDTFFNLVRTNGNAIIYTGYDSCPVCNEAVWVMEEVAAELDLTIYYIDCYHALYPLIDYIGEYMQVTDPILDSKNGEKVVLTPHVFTIQNGEFKDSWIGIDMLDPSSNEDDHKIVYDKYKKIMQNFNAE